MNSRFIRDSFAGRMVYHLSKHKYFSHPEEQNDYEVPDKYLGNGFKLLEFEKTNGTAFERYGYTNSSSDSTVEEQGCKIMVDWEGEDDPENPVNWPSYQKVIFIFEIAFLTTVVFMGSSIYTPGISEIMEEFDIGETTATLPLTLFVIGYGMGPMVFSPMSENAALGRTSIYIVTLFLFCILQIPTALANNIVSLSILRFLGGVFASPCLATGAASACDVLSLPYGPIGIACWSLGAICGPSLGPFFGSILVVKGDWRWPFWLLCITSGFILIMFSFLLPESYGKTLLYRKAKRLRALTGNEHITSEGEIEISRLTFSEIAIETLWRPIEITILEPVVLLINLYVAMVYSILYLWFEAFPIVFYDTHHFTLIEMGLSYFAIVTGFLIAASVYIPVVLRIFTRPLQRGEPVVPELFIPITMIGGTLLVIGVLIFGWTSAADIHWMGPIIGAAIFAAGAFLVFKTLFNYLGMSFPRYLASVFAGNDLCRSVMAGIFPLFGRSLFNNLKTSRFPVAWGCTILGVINVFMLLIPILFYLNGPKLRARSKYSGSG